MLIKSSCSSCQDECEQEISQGSAALCAVQLWGVFCQDGREGTPPLLDVGDTSFLSFSGVNAASVREILFMKAAHYGV